MKRYVVNIEQEEYIVEIHPDGQITINGVMVEESAFAALNDQGLYLIQTGTEKEEIHIQRETQTDYRITVDGHHLIAQIEQENGRKQRKKKQQGNHSGNVKAPMPGLIVELTISEGDSVEADQTLFVLEAMKMQMKIKSPSKGSVHRIHFQQGDRVEKGDLIVSLESIVD
jgi:pyruvate carboxylase subunit B